jgi:hypothetical protein
MELARLEPATSWVRSTAVVKNSTTELSIPVVEMSRPVGLVGRSPPDQDVRAATASAASCTDTGEPQDEPPFDTPHARALPVGPSFSNAAYS